MDVLLVASGKSSRLIDYTHDYIPKFLLNIDNYPALVKIIQYWSKYAKRFFLVIHESFDHITQFIIDHFLKEFKESIFIFHYNEYNGTAFTIDFIYKKYLNNYNIKNLLISWSDILPEEELNMHHFELQENNLNKTMKNKIYVFTYGNDCRYILDNNEIKLSDQGNIIGIYYIKNLDYFLENVKENIDIVEYLKKLNNTILFEYELNKVLDFGDAQKYKTIIELQNDINKLNCRSFNEILIKNGKILKKSIHEKGLTVIKHEMEFYKFLNLQNNEELLNLFPKIDQFYDSAFSMVYKKDYINLYKSLKLNNIHKNKNIITQVLNKLNVLHSFKTEKIKKTQFLYDIKAEIYDKIINRISIIQPLLNHFPKFKKVNDIYIYDFDFILKWISQYIFNYYELLDNYEYVIIHGDPNFSNILIHQENDDICFIDPRGYFSTNKIFGPIEYDYAKILYGLSGYDEFNNHHFKIDSINEHEIKFNIQTIPINKEFIDQTFNKIHKMFMVIIWLGLAEYNKNNIWKCVASYYHGLYLGTKLFIECQNSNTL